MHYRKTRQPIQIWSPLILNSIHGEEFKLDLLKAESLYDEEDIIWLSPKANKVARWKEHWTYHLLVPSRTINKITVYNIDKMGCIFPHIGNIKKIDMPMYTKWLEEPPENQSINKPLKIAFPHTTKKEAYYKDIEIKSDTAFIKGHKKNISMKLREEKPTIVDYELEIFDQFLQKSKIPNSHLVWPSPFNSFFVTGGGINVFYDFYLMKNYLKMYPENKTVLMKEVQNKVSSFMSDAESSLMKSWFIPKLNYNIDTLLGEIEYEFGLDFTNVEELESSKELEDIINERISIKRIYSWLGYFWWEFYQDILKHITIKFCENCGQIFSGGRQDRIYCTKEENPNCWKERSALRQKRKYNKDKNL